MDMQQVNEKTMERVDFGVYFLSNNREIHWAYAFLSSFRKFNPDLPLTLIPYNDQYDKIAALAERFNFDVLASDSYSVLDALNDTAWPGRGNRMFRKFAAFSGIYNHFFYLDTDIIITSDLRPLATAAQQSGQDLVYVDADKDHIEHVYKPGPLREKMIVEYQTKAFNAGAWYGRRGLFSLEQIAAVVEETATVRDQFMHSGDQPYLNYCCDTLRAKTSLFSQVLPRLMPTGMTRAISLSWDGNHCVQAEGESAGREVYLIHYAGFGIPHADMPNYGFYLANRAKGQGIFITQMWNLRWQGQRIKWKVLGWFKPKSH